MKMINRSIWKNKNKKQKKEKNKLMKNGMNFMHKKFNVIIVENA